MLDNIGDLKVTDPLLNFNYGDRQDFTDLTQWLQRIKLINYFESVLNSRKTPKMRPSVTWLLAKGLTKGNHFNLNRLWIIEENLFESTDVLELDALDWLIRIHLWTSSSHSSSITDSTFSLFGRAVTQMFMLSYRRYLAWNARMNLLLVEIPLILISIIFAPLSLDVSYNLAQLPHQSMLNQIMTPTSFIVLMLISIVALASLLSGSHVNFIVPRFLIDTTEKHFIICWILNFNSEIVINVNQFITILNYGIFSTGHHVTEIHHPIL